jgi:Ni,Fe-hydrogenase III small subunit
MRQFINGNGVDSTSTVVAYLATAKLLALADLYLIGEQSDPLSKMLTNWNSPLLWPAWGTFQPAVLNRGKITSEIGLKVDSMSLEWSPPLTAFGTSVATSNPYQLAQQGYYDNQRVRIWRCIMPTPGDANTYGACQWFGGRIADTVIERGKITFTINSFLDAANQKVPPNVIELSNGLSGYSGAAPVFADGETSIPTFTVVAPSNTNNILGDCIQPSAHKIYALNRFKYGFMYFLPGSTLAGYWSPIGSNASFNAGGGIHYNEFLTYAAFPFAPTPGDTFYASIQWPVNLQDANVGAGQFKGFPYVPPPTTAI